MKFKTVREGEQALIYNHRGEGHVVIGPMRVFLFRKRLEKLRRHTASQFEYLVVENNEGLVQHIPGPVEMFENPLEQRRISVKKAIKIDANHMAIAYHKLKDNSMVRQVIDGPSLFIPTAQQWLHEFVWHGTDPHDKTHLIPNGRKFTQLTAIPEHLYYNVRDVRTADDTMLTMKVMMFYQLTDVTQMLESTQDPIADMVNALCADVIAFTGKITYQDFLSRSHELSSLENYVQLMQRAERIGFKVIKVVYRGYHASDQLQAMQDSAIESRTELRLQAELEEQKQRLADFQLHKQRDRSQLKQEIEKMQVEHRQRVDKMKSLQQMLIEENEMTAKLKLCEVDAKSSLDCERSRMEHSLNYLQKLINLTSIDLTKYLIQQQPAAISDELHVLPSTVKSGNVKSGASVVYLPSSEKQSQVTMPATSVLNFSG